MMSPEDQTCLSCGKVRDLCRCTLKQIKGVIRSQDLERAIAAEAQRDRYRQALEEIDSAHECEATPSYPPCIDLAERCQRDGCDCEAHDRSMWCAACRMLELAHRALTEEGNETP